MSSNTICVLVFEQNQFYVMKSMDPLQDYFYFRNLEQYSPCKLLGFYKIIVNAPEKFEELLTIYYMAQFGLDNVRSDRYNSQILSSNDLNEILSVLNETNFHWEMQQSCNFSL